MHNKPSDRSLPFWIYTDPKENDPFKCSSECHRKGFEYSGVQFGTECHCGMAAPPHRYLADTNQCNTKCSSGWSLPAYGICGGHEKATVFKTQSKNFEEKNYLRSRRPEAPLCPSSMELTDRLNNSFRLNLYTNKQTWMGHRDASASNKTILYLVSCICILYLVSCILYHVPCILYLVSNKTILYLVYL